MIHLLVGLGGMGGEVLDAFRASAVTRVGGVSNTVSLDYLLVDSDPSSFLENASADNTPPLPKRSQLLIARPEREILADALRSWKNLQPWVGDLAAGEGVLSAGAPGAARNRRLGRAMFAMSAQRYREAAQLIVQDMLSKSSAAAELRLHICCGLGDGAGSGVLIDAIVQLRLLYPAASVVAYGILPPDTSPVIDQANAYAALVELSALAAGSWSPFDVAGGGERVHASDSPWFNGLYLSDAESGVAARRLADFLFHKIVVAADADSEILARIEDGETSKFLAFGLKSLDGGLATRRERLSRQLFIQATNHLRFNNEVAGAGFLASPAPPPDPQRIAQQEGWRLTNEHLFLSRPILQRDDGAWSTYEDEWAEWERHYLEIVRRLDSDQAIDRLTEHFQRAWTTHFRQLGVGPFFEDAARNRRGFVAVLKAAIERSLFEGWRKGELSLGACRGLVEALAGTLASRGDSIDREVGQRTAASEALQRRVADIRLAWRHRRRSSAQRSRELGEAAFLLREDYVARTYAIGGVVAHLIIDDLARELRSLAASLDGAEAGLERALSIPDEPMPAVEAMELHRLAQNAREKLLAATSASETFADFLERLDGVDITAAVAAAADEEADRVSRGWAEALNPDDAGAVKRIEAAWSADPVRIATEAADLVRAAKPALAESNSPDTLHTFVFLPPAVPSSILMDAVKDGFRRAASGAELVPGHLQAGDITVITLAEDVALQSVRELSRLKDRYDEVLRGSPEAETRVHVEDGLSSLPTLSPSRPNHRTLVLLGLATGVLAVGPDGLAVLSNQRSPSVLARGKTLQPTGSLPSLDFGDLRAALAPRLKRVNRKALGAPEVLEAAVEQVTSAYIAGATDEEKVAWTLAATEAWKVLIGDIHL